MIWGSKWCAALRALAAERTLAPTVEASDAHDVRAWQHRNHRIILKFIIADVTLIALGNSFKCHRLGQIPFHHGLFDSWRWRVHINLDRVIILKIRLILGLVVVALGYDLINTNKCTRILDAVHAATLRCLEHPPCLGLKYDVWLVEKVMNRKTRSCPTSSLLEMHINSPLLDVKVDLHDTVNGNHSA